MKKYGELLSSSLRIKKLYRRIFELLENGYNENSDEIKKVSEYLRLAREYDDKLYRNLSDLDKKQIIEYFERDDDESFLYVSDIDFESSDIDEIRILGRIRKSNFVNDVVKSDIRYVNGLPIVYVFDFYDDDIGDCDNLLDTVIPFVTISHVDYISRILWDCNINNQDKFKIIMNLSYSNSYVEEYLNAIDFKLDVFEIDKDLSNIISFYSKSKSYQSLAEDYYKDDIFELLIGLKNGECEELELYIITNMIISYYCLLNDEEKEEKYSLMKLLCDDKIDANNNLKHIFKSLDMCNNKDYYVKVKSTNI